MNAIPAFTCTYNDDIFAFTAPVELRDSIKRQGGTWNPFERQWQLRKSDATLDLLRSIQGLNCDASAQQLLWPPEPEPETTAAPDPDAIVPKVPIPLRNITPMRHQIAAYNRGLELFGYDGSRSGGGYALLHDPGCGKTLTAVALASRLHMDGLVHRVLVVCPVSVMPVWAPEFRYSTAQVTVTTLKGSGKDRENELLKPPPSGLWIVVINYESAWRLINPLVKWKPDMLICDESQRAKNHRALQAKALHDLGKRCRFCMIMTGTPINNTPLDFWSQYKIIRPDLFPSSYLVFRNRYATMGGYEGKVVVAYKHLDELARVAHSVAHRVSKAEALDLPPYTDQLLHCELEPEARRAYNELKRHAVTELSAADVVTADMIITQLLRLSQLTGGFVKTDGAVTVTPVSKAKLKLLRETLEDLKDQDKKVVVFARFVPELKAIIKLAEEIFGQHGVAAIWGEVPQTKRGPLVQAFQTDPMVKVFVAQTRTAGLGITLHAADTCIFYSLDYSYDTYEQARARIHRTGQRNACTAIHLIADDTIDEAILDALRGKRNIATDLVDNWQTIFGRRSAKNARSNSGHGGRRGRKPDPLGSSPRLLSEAVGEKGS